MQEDVFSTDQPLVPELLEYFQISQLLLSSVFRRSNGFFTHERMIDKDGNLQAYCV
jgi:hypothetical protein